VALDPEGLLRALAPDVRRLRVALAMARLDLVVGQHAERRDDVLSEVLVLVIAPHDHDVGIEFVEQLAGVAAVAGHLRARGRPRRWCPRRCRPRAASPPASLPDRDSARAAPGP